MFSWTIKQPADGIVVAPDERLPWPQTIALGIQHVVAMFGGTVLGPLLMGFLVLGSQMQVFQTLLKFWPVPT